MSMKSGQLAHSSFRALHAVCAACHLAGRWTWWAASACIKRTI